jgi:putative MFS transporter
VTLNNGNFSIPKYQIWGLIMISNAAERLDRLPISKFHYRILLVLAVGRILDGFDLYILSGIIASMEKNGWSTVQMNANLVSISFIGLFLGALVSGFFSDRYGRKTMFIWNMLIYSIASLLCAVAINFEMLLIMRLIATAGLGGEVITGYTVFGEFIPPSKRGQWGSFLFLITNLSLPLATFTGTLILPLSPEAWRWMFVLAGIPAFLAWLIQRHLPESPRWLDTMGRYEEADRIVSSIEAEIEQSTGEELPPATVKPYVQQETVSVKQLFSKTLLPILILCIGIYVLTNVIVYSFTTWLPSSFVQSGLSITKSMGFTTIMMIGGPLGGLIGVLISDRLSRKWMVVTLSVVGAIVGYFYGISQNNTQIIVLGFAMTTVIYFIVCVTWTTYIPEQFPTAVRARGTGIGGSLGRLSAAGSPYLVVFLVNKFGFSGVLMAISCIFVLLAIIVVFLGKETKGKSLEEINS